MDTNTPSPLPSGLLESTAPSDSASSYIKCRKDLNLARRAIRERWPMSDETRRNMIDRLKIIGAESEDERSAVAAIKALIEADKLNLADEKFQSEEARLESGSPTKIIEHTGSKSLAGGLSLTPDDLAAVAGILGVGVGVGLAASGAALPSDNRPQPVGSAQAAPSPAAIPPPR